MALPKPRNVNIQEGDSNDALVARHVERYSPLDTPDDARLSESGTRVTTVIMQLTAAGRDIADVARSYHLSEEAVRAAILYYERHKAVIDARITLNDAWATREGALHEERGEPITPFASSQERPRWEPQTPEDHLIARHVETAPGYPTADVARLSESGVRVATVIRQLQTDGWDIPAVARSYRLSEEAVHAAIAYYKRYKTLIDARITLNEAQSTSEGSC